MMAGPSEPRISRSSRARADRFASSRRRARSTSTRQQNAKSGANSSAFRTSQARGRTQNTASAASGSYASDGSATNDAPADDDTLDASPDTETALVESEARRRPTSSGTRQTNPEMPGIKATR